MLGKVIEDTNEAFNTVENGINQSITGIIEIKDELEKLRETKEETVTHVKNVSNLAEQNAASTQETAAAIEEVSTIISMMTDEVGNLEKASLSLKEKASAFKIEQ